MTKVSYVFIDKNNLPKVEKSPLSRYRQNRMSLTNDDFKSVQGVVAELLLINLLETPKSKLPLEIGVGASQKPFLDDQMCYFNLSHSEELIAAAISSQEVGVDVEKVNPNKIRIAKYLLSEKEKKTFFYLTKDEQLIFLFKVWVAKESYFKMIGTGIGKTLNQVSINFYDSGTRFKVTEKGHTYFGKIFMIDDYYLAVSTKTENEVLVTKRELSEII